jgi:hypothetical protein
MQGKEERMWATKMLRGSDREALREGIVGGAIKARGERGWKGRLEGRQGRRKQ